jgi:cysteine-rich repeat protein
LKFFMLALLAMAACFDPKLSDNPVCGPGEDNCPADRKCLGGRCVTAGCGGLADAVQCFQGAIEDGICLDQACVPRGCGDHVIAPDETCDDGNRKSGDGCSGDCQSLEVCGNGYLDVLTEECDPAIATSGPCRATTDPHPCTIPQCGDGVVDASNGEACDLGTAANLDTPNSGCRSNCQLDRCGDGIVDVGAPLFEVCDNGNLLSGDGCSGDCLSNETCGNSYVDFATGEQCDVGRFGLSADGCSSTCTVELADWKDITPPPFNIRSGAMAFDPHRGRTVMFGDFTTRGENVANTWEFDGLNWALRHPATSPPYRSGAAMAFDGARNRILLFGGGDAALTELADTWEYDGTTWTQLSPATSPPARAFHAMAYDSVRKRVVMFGGEPNGIGHLTDTWEFDGTTWIQRFPSVKPRAREFAGMAFDSTRNKIVMFGGNIDLVGNSAETWEFDGTNWSLRTPASPPPPGSVTAAFDELSHVVIVVRPGGDTFLFDGSDWTQLFGTILPPASIGEPIAFDQARQRTVLAGAGLDAETWTLDGVTWTNVTPRSAPPAVVTAFDSARGRIVAFGGQAGLESETWEFDGTSWLQVSPPLQPQPRTRQSLAFDTHRRVSVLFGGIQAEPFAVLADTWEYDGTTWTQRHPTTSPPGRFDHVTCFDTSRNRLVLFGGSTSGQADLTDTWEFTGTTWVLIHPAISPPARQFAGMAFDAVRNRCVLFGGVDQAQNLLADTWEYDGVAWTQRVTAHAPPPRFAGLAFNLVRGRILLFGGGVKNQVGTPASPASDTWEFDGQDWTPISTASIPPPGFSRDLETYDTANERVIVSGLPSAAGPAGTPSTWAFSFTSASQPRDACAAGVDSDGDGLIACGDATHDADPDCAGRCTPACPAANAALPCDLQAPHCGDGICSVIEDHTLCPVDCAAP